MGNVYSSINEATNSSKYTYDDDINFGLAAGFCVCVDFNVCVRVCVCQHNSE
jgi:hypothetical protein